jgi:ribonuclease J
VDGLRTDVGRLAEVGNRGVDLLLGDSTNAERPGVTGSERLVGEAFRQLIPPREGRILVASFASNVHRMQQAIDVAVDVGRKVCVVGRSMRKNINIARNLGYIEVPEDVLIQPKELDDYGRGDVLILCTGSQGEPLSALVRIAYNDHPAIKVEAGDTVIISAKPVPGNELKVHDAINELARSGAEVLHQEVAPVHVSGHGNAE